MRVLLDEMLPRKVDHYRHAGKWTNRMILGDSLLVMTSMAGIDVGATP